MSSARTATTTSHSTSSPASESVAPGVADSGRTGNRESSLSPSGLVCRHQSVQPQSHVATWYSVKGTNGDQTWRVESPARAVGAKVNYIPDGNDGGAALYWPNDSEYFPWRLVRELDGGRDVIQSRSEWESYCVAHRGETPEFHIEHLNQEGEAAVFTRPLAFGAAHMLGMKQEGIRVLAEVDDNYLAKHHLNYFMEKANRELAEEGKSWDSYVDDHARSICSGDGIIVSTEHLRDVYWKQLGELFGKRNIPEIFVCRNLVDERFVPAEWVPRREDGKLRIGYMGSDSHLWDIDLIYEACVEAYVNGHEIVFVGIDPANINPKYRRSKKNWSRIDYTHIPWTNNFRGTALPLDIGFAPLLVDQHTLCKSDIKALEYGMSGAACVAQNCLVYNRTLRHDEHVLMANSPLEFVQQMRRLIQDDDLRTSLVGATGEYIRGERMLMDHADEWREAVLG